ncbi:MAG: peptidase [Candidatus Competibacteraceae bacterium]|nr:peptidase [Candidatus Competibacteraceae bacterium]
MNSLSTGARRLLAAVWLGALLTTTALAQQSEGDQELSRDRAAAIAREVSGGRVLGVEVRRQDGAPVYLVKVLLADGRVRVLPVDGRTGQVER